MLLLIPPVLIFLLHPLVKCEWVEIPQISSKKKPQTSQSSFVFGAPKSPVPTTMPSITGNVLKKPTFMTTTLPTTTSIRRNSVERKSDRESVQTTTEAYKNATDFFEKQEQVKESENGFLQFLNAVQNTLTHNSKKKSLKSKVDLLRNLRDKLLINIEEKMDSLWNKPDRNIARGHHNDEHELDFPSNEGALMTIGFLTFAVFLIKIVLKLIHVLKNKSNKGMMPTMSGVMMGTQTGRKKRHLEESVDILRLIDEFQFTQL